MRTITTKKIIKLDTKICGLDTFCQRQYIHKLLNKSTPFEEIEMWFLQRTYKYHYHISLSHFNIFENYPSHFSEHECSRSM